MLKANVQSLLVRLRACCKSRDLKNGKKVHAEAIESGEDTNDHIATTLVDLYAKCGCMNDAHGIFDKMASRNLAAWTTLIMGYAQTGEGDKGLHLFERMQTDGFAPDPLAFAAALLACAAAAGKEKATEVGGKSVKKKSLEKGMAIHFEATKSGCDSHKHVATALVEMYAKSGSMIDARSVFVSNRNPGVMLWNALMWGYLESGNAEIALQTFSRMQAERCGPNARSFLGAFMACINLSVKEVGEELDGKLVKVGWLRTGRALHYEASKHDCDSDHFVANAIIEMYSKCGNMPEARKLFERMAFRDVVSWTSLITGYANNGDEELALHLFMRMKSEHHAPNAVTFVSVLKACGSLGAVDFSESLHADIKRCGFQNDVTVAISLMDFYAKCGNMIPAQEIFDRVFNSVGQRDFASWNTLLAGYSLQGNAYRVFDLLEKMQKEGFEANSLTFLSVLNACYIAGDVDKGKEYFGAMCKNGIVPSIAHYRCMVDILASANQLDDAAAMVEKKDDVVAWTNILGACRKWRNLEVGKTAFDALLRINPKQFTAYMLMADIYSNAGMCEESLAMRKNAQACLRNSSQRSWWTNEAGIVHKFSIGSAFQNLQNDDINSKLKDIKLNARKELPDDETEDALCGHTTKLAIACALINTKAKKSVLVVSNFQICEKCQRTIAIISKIEQRNIICRDQMRLYTFES